MGHCHEVVSNGSEFQSQYRTQIYSALISVTADLSLITFEPQSLSELQPTASATSGRQK